MTKQSEHKDFKNYTANTLEDKLYSVEDIATMFSVTSRTIRNWIKDGILKGKKIGGTWRFSKAELFELMNSEDAANELIDQTKQKVMDFIDGVDTDYEGNLQICSIIDKYAEKEKLFEINQRVSQFINSNSYFDDNAQQNQGKQNFKMTYEYSEEQSRGRFILFGNAKYTTTIINIINDFK